MDDTEFFFNQIYEDFKYNVENDSLPFFKENVRFPQELRTGKMISYENIPALEMAAARYKYKSNMWIYGEDLESLDRQGYKITTKGTAKPVLCITKYHNANHLNEKEIYTTEGGSKQKVQFMYNLDSFDEETQHRIIKHLGMNPNSLGEKITRECAKNFHKNGQEALIGTKNPVLVQAQELMKKNAYVNGNYSRVIAETQMKYSLDSYTNGEIPFLYKTQDETKNKLYETCRKLIEDADSRKISGVDFGKDISNCLENAIIYSKKLTSDSYDLSKSKIEEEKLYVAERLKSYGRKNTREITYER